jgi:hypothetical protein
MDFFRMVCAGAWVSVLPLDVEANWLGIPNWWNSPHQMILSLLVGLGLAWAVHGDEKWALSRTDHD